jgi:hypothetical protein
VPIKREGTEERLVATVIVENCETTTWSSLHGARSRLGRGRTVAFSAENFSALL